MREGFKLLHEDDVAAAYYKVFLQTPDVEKEILKTMLDNQGLFFRISKTNVTENKYGAVGFYNLVATEFKIEEGGDA
jgi:hypothetical protein